MRKAVLLLLTSVLAAAELPQAELTNGSLRVKLYLPDAANGFYRASRFDWSGMIYSLEYGGHQFYGPWFQRTDPKVHDFIYQGSEIVAGPCTAATGPAEEFTDLGYNDAKPGGTFLKIGVGVLRRPDDTPYDHFKLYEVVDPGKWKTNVTPTAVEFTQQVNDPATGYGYEYRKTVRLAGQRSGVGHRAQLPQYGAQADFVARLQPQLPGSGRTGARAGRQDLRAVRHHQPQAARCRAWPRSAAKRSSTARPWRGRIA